MPLVSQKTDDVCWDVLIHSISFQECLIMPFAIYHVLIEFSKNVKNRIKFTNRKDITFFCPKQTLGLSILESVFGAFMKAMRKSKLVVKILPIQMCSTVTHPNKIINGWDGITKEVPSLSYQFVDGHQ